MTAIPLRATTERVPLDRRLLAPRPRGADEARANRLDDGLWCLRVPVPYERPRSVNCYLLAGSDGWTLVDCGSAVGPGWAGLERALALAGVEPRAVTTLLLTHLHADHASLAGEAVARLRCELVRLAGPAVGNDRLREPLLALEARRRGARAEGVPADDMDDIVDALLAGDGAQPRPPADRLLAAGDVVAGWEVVPALGHSPQQLMLWDRARRCLISADLAYADVRPYLEWGFTADPVAEHLEAIERAESLDAALVLPGHGPPDAGAAERLAATWAALQDLVSAVDAALGRAPSSAYEVTCRVAGRDPDPDVRQAWLTCSLCVLEHLQARGAVTAGTGSDGIRRFAREHA